MKKGIIIKFDKENERKFYNEWNEKIDYNLLIISLLETLNDICKYYNLDIKQQMVYVGDKNAFNELVTAYDDLQQRIDKLNKYMEEHGYDYAYQDCKFNETQQYDDIQSILQGEEVN